MKYSEVPRFVKAINNKHSISEIIGKVYDTRELPKWVKGHSLEKFWVDYYSNYEPVIDRIQFNYLIL